MIDFPVKGPQPWTLTVDQLHVWTQIYVHVDVLTEVRKAWAWCEANPSKRKTARGMPRFLVGWLNQAMTDYWAVIRRPGAPGQSMMRRDYEAWKALGGCPHTPPCPHYTACQMVSGRGR